MTVQYSWRNIDVSHKKPQQQSIYLGRAGPYRVLTSRGVVKVLLVFWAIIELSSGVMTGEKVTHH